MKEDFGEGQLGFVGVETRRTTRPAAWTGDFNVSRESALFDEFMAATGLADAFGGACPATFRAEYLPAGATQHCIDFILTADAVTVESTGLVFAEKKEPLGYVSDHIGLRARLSLALPGDRLGRGRAPRRCRRAGVCRYSTGIKAWPRWSAACRRAASRWSIPSGGWPDRG